MKRKVIILGLSAAIALAACGPESSENNGDNATPNNAVDMEPGRYSFTSRYDDGADSVAYSGQVARQVLIDDLATFIGNLNDDIDSGDFTVGGDGSVVSALDFYFRFDSDTYGEEPILFSTEEGTTQSTYASISTGKDLVGKLAGNDSVTDHKDFGSEFSGWSDDSLAEHGGGIDSPEAFVTALFEQLEENAIARADGVDRTGPNGEVLPVAVTEEGWDLQQLTQKFLHGAVALSQGTDDYLDDDVEGKGLLSPNTQDDDAPYTVLEHQWDEGFGYFGAARTYLDFSDEAIAETPYDDVDGDGSIDLLTEVNFGASTAAAKRDAGSATGTDFTSEVFEALYRGRAIIAAAPEGETLDDATLDALREQRDIAVVAWEKALAATVVHYINDTIEDTEKIGGDDYDIAHHAKVWSEMKGYALAFQFNPHSPMSDGDFEAVHGLFGDRPVLTEEDGEAYVEDLLEARGILAEAYDFETEDVEAW